MKTMTCNDLAGACDLEFHAETFEEMAELAKQHGIEMMERGEWAHVEAGERMMALMSDQQAMRDWVVAIQEKFAGLPDD